MALIGALAENTRRNERVERGSVTVTGSATVGVTASQTVNLTPAYGAQGGMRQMTEFQLTLDDGGTAFTAADPVQVSGHLNAAGTILTINVYLLAAGSLGPSIVATTVHYQIWGN